MRYVKNILSLTTLLLFIACAEDADLNSGGEGTGIGGSMTRYTIDGNYLYAVNDRSLKTYLIANNSFSEIQSQELEFGLETIFARNGYLYLGANDGMYIFDISNPMEPTFIFRYVHIVACDPVVVQGNRAYITLRSGQGVCNRAINALEIIDITNRNNPTFLARYDMISPHGLAVDGNHLFLCEGNSGFKIFDITDEKNITLIQHIESLPSFDVIARANRLTVTGADGIFQYQYPSAGEGFVKLLSEISVNRL